MANRDVIKNLSATRITTSNTTDTDALTATGTPTNGSKDFWVLCSAVIDKASTSSDVKAKLIDSTGAADLCVWNIEPQDTTDFTGVFGLAKWTSPASPVSQSFKLQYSTDNTTAVGIDEMAIVAIESHTSDQYAGTDAETTTTSASAQDAQTLTFTPGTQGDYLIVCYGEGATDTVGQIMVRMDIDGTSTHLARGLDSRDTTNYVPWIAVRKVNLTAASHTVKIQFYALVAGNTVRIRRRRILALRLDTIRLNSSTYTAARSTTTSTTAVDAASTTFTAEGSIDYFVIGNLVLDGSDNTISINAQLSMDGVAASLHTKEISNSVRRRTWAALNYSSFSSGSRTVKTQVYSETNLLTTGYEFNGIYVLDLREATGPASYDDAVSETFSITDTAANYLLIGGSLTETLTITDAATAGKLITDAVAEALGLADTNAATLTIGGSVTESLSAADDGAAQAIFGAALSEALSATDAGAGALDINEALAESLALAETASSGLAFLVDLTETLDVADAVAASLTIPAAIAEALAFTDAAVSLATLNPAISEALGIGDAVASQAILQSVLAEALAMTDAADGVRTFAEALAETLAATDTATSTAAFNAALSEAVSLTDAVSLTGIYQDLLAENISVADFMVGARDIYVAIAEALEISEAAAAALLTIVILTGMLRIRPALAGQANTSPAMGGATRTSPALDADIKTKARVAATASRIRAALAGKTNIGD